MKATLTTSQLIVNLEKVTSPAMIAITANLNSRQLGHIDAWMSGSKDLTDIQRYKLSFAWSVLVTMTNVNGKAATARWYQSPCIPIVRRGKEQMVSPARAIALREYETVLRSLGPV